MLRWSFALLLALPVAFPLAAQAQINVSLDSKIDGENVPIRLPVQWSKEWPTPTTITIAVDGMRGVFAQLTEPNFVTEKIKAQDGKVRKDIVFILPKIKAGNSAPVSITVPTRGELSIPSTFVWKDTPGDHEDLLYATDNGAKSQLVMRYMDKTYDTSSKDARNKSYKVFHHLYDTAGKQVTNGGHNDPHENEKDLLFPHHRGLMFGFNKCSYDGKEGKSADTWHCTGDAHVSHVKTLFETAGPVMGEHRVLLAWHGAKNEIFAEEERQMTVYKVPGGTLVEFASRLTPKVQKVHLDGDPQHAGFQFRASNEVRKTGGQTYYLRPDGKGKNGETRNWDGKNKSHADLPWDVLSFVIDGKRYSVEYIDHPSNPGEKRYSERDYGRFGCYFVYDLTPQNPLVLNHRIWLQEGEMTGEQAQSLRDAFVNPPQVSGK